MSYVMFLAVRSEIPAPWNSMRLAEIVSTVTVLDSLS